MLVEMNKTSQTIQSSLLSEDRFLTPSGNKMAPIIENKYNEDLKKEVATKTGEFDIYEEIQMSSNGTEIEMLKRAAKNSGVPVENDPDLVEGFNQSLVPNDIHEAMRINANVKESFAKLPEDIRKELFKGNANDYLSAVIDGSINTKINDFYVAKAQAAQSAAQGKGETE